MSLGSLAFALSEKVSNFNTKKAIALHKHGKGTIRPRPSVGWYFTSLSTTKVIWRREVSNTTSG